MDMNTHLRPAVAVGVDGGGTKTSLIAYRFEDDGTVRELSRAVVGGINYNTVGIKTASARFLDGLAALRINPDEICAVGIGDPSCDIDAVGEQGEAFRAILSQTLKLPILIKSDAYVTLFALTDGKTPGVLTVSGTGAISIGEDRTGRVFVRGGWGQLTGDEGSAYYIGLCGLKAALRFADGIARPTSLLDILIKEYGCSDPRGLIQVLYREDSPFSPAEFAPAVDRCANGGDTVSREILLRAASFLADYTTSVIRVTNAELLGIYGSVLTGNATVRQSFTKTITDRFPGIIVREPDTCPELAAAKLAFATVSSGNNRQKGHNS